MSLASIVAMFVGEALCIYSELLYARGASWWWAFFLITLAGVPLLYGYKYGALSAASVWPVFVVSLVSILIVEPLMVRWMFDEMPTKGSLAGFAFGVAGLLVTMFWK